MAKKKATKTNPPPVKAGEVDFYFDKYALAHQNQDNKRLQIIAIPLLLFSLFGLLWCVPFPYIAFLGQYNSYFNCASVFIAVCIYFYLKLSPILSYFMLFVLLAFSYVIMQLQQWQKTGGPALWLVCGVILIISVILLGIGYSKERKKLSYEYRYKNILIAPLFLLHLVAKRFKIKY
jgi:uncharacterized membrane protein YGL010W